MVGEPPLDVPEVVLSSPQAAARAAIKPTASRIGRIFREPCHSERICSLRGVDIPVAAQPGHDTHHRLL
jgi:hypothetical protein